MIDHTEAMTLALEHEAVSPEQVVAGSPTTGTARLGAFGGAEYGVWEMSAGVMIDVEENEVFIALAGTATLEFLDGGDTFELAPGSVMQLTAGSRTRWTVTERFRKIYLA